MSDAINFARLSIPARARVLELRASHYCQSCEEVVPADRVEHSINPAGQSCHYAVDSSGWHPCGPVVPAPVYVRRKGNGWDISTKDAPGWALVLG